jgi:glycosyltransferase involved in cell wall biosynthesis
VATPAGATGQGGIDRLMASLRAELERQSGLGIDVRFVATRGTGSVLLSPFYTLGFLGRMIGRRLTGRLDLVHLNVSSSGSTFRKLIIAAAARTLGVPYVVHLHGAGYRDFWSDKRPLVSRLIRRMFEGAGRSIVLGRIWRDFVASRAPASAERIVIVPNATEMPRLPHVGGGDTVHILFLGQIGARKGVPQLGEALQHMRLLPGWRATIAGDGEVDTARRVAAEMGLADRVALPGWVGPDDVARLISTADILVLPSFAENLPVSVIEGMASGLAVVTTPVGAVEDIVTHEVSGLLVAPGDVDGLTDALTRVVTDSELRARLGAAARAVHRERLELGAFARAISDVWHAAAQTRSNDRRPRPLESRPSFDQTKAISNEHQYR